MYLIENYISLALVEISVILQQRIFDEWQAPLSIANKVLNERSVAVTNMLTVLLVENSMIRTNDESLGGFSFARV